MTCPKWKMVYRRKEVVFNIWQTAQALWLVSFSFIHKSGHIYSSLSILGLRVCHWAATWVQTWNMLKTTALTTILHVSQSAGIDQLIAETVVMLLVWSVWTKPQCKKRSEETQTLHAGCSKAEPKIPPCHRPPSRGCGIVTTFNYKPSLLRIDARNFELSW